MHLVIVSGRSGAGKSSILRALEDLSYYCIDNLPLALIEEGIKFFNESSPKKNIAISIDIRTFGLLDKAPLVIMELKKKCSQVDIVFVNAQEQTLIRRFSETRRIHPLSKKSEIQDINQSLKEEATALAPLIEMATLVIDSSTLSVHELRKQIQQYFAVDKTNRLIVKVLSFGFKNGIPLDVDTIFDVRFLPNPHWEIELRSLTGKNIEVQRYLELSPLTKTFLTDIENHLKTWLPEHIKNGRQTFTVAIGCTGGRHRSVFIADKLYRQIASELFKSQIMHRDIAYDDTFKCPS